MKKIKSNNTLQQAANAFETLQSSAADIENAGEQVMCLLYNGNPNESLNILRYKRFCEKVATSLAPVQPHVLPPTAPASKFHSFRLFNQICQWKGSIMTIMLPNDVPPAPEELSQGH